MEKNNGLLKKIHRYGFLGDDAVYIRGIFYFVNYGGQVASYDITHGVWRDKRDSDDTSDNLFRMQEVFQLDGDLVRICIGKDYPNRKYLSCFIRKFDMFKKVWFPVKSLGGDRAMFVGRNTLYVSTEGEEAKKNGVSASNIYSLNMIGGLTVHSLDYGKLIDITKGSEISKWVMDDDDCEITSFWLEPLHQI